MNILKETTEPQILDYTPEINGVMYIFLVDEQTKETQEIYVEPQTISYFERVTATFDLKENHFYSYVCVINKDVANFKERVIEDGGVLEAIKCLIDKYKDEKLTIVYKGRIFCTNQNIDDFKLLDGEFKEYKKPNEFVIYE
jgi:hypothetical protein